MCYEKDIFGIIEYEFELLHKSRRKPCISSKRSFVYHHCEKKCSLRPLRPEQIYTTYSGFYSEKPSSPRILSSLFPCTPYGCGMKCGRENKMNFKRCHLLPCQYYVVVTPNNFDCANSTPYFCCECKCVKFTTH